MSSPEIIEQVSLFLAYRRHFPFKVAHPKHRYANEDELLDFIREFVGSYRCKIGMALSGGMDSAVVAHFLKPGDICYTLTYPHDDGEFNQAARYVPSGLEHKKVHITKEMYFKELHFLTTELQEIVVPHQPTISILVRQARQDGCKAIASGFACDGRHAGFGFLHEVPRYYNFLRAMKSFQINPVKVLNNPAPVDWVIQDYTTNDIVDVCRFLSEVGTEGSAIEDTITYIHNLEACIPYKHTRYYKPCPVGVGLGKPFIKKAFKKIYGDQAPKKHALSVPYAKWIKGWKPTRPEFRSDIKMKPGKKLCQLYALEAWLNVVDPLT